MKNLLLILIVCCSFQSCMLKKIVLIDYNVNPIDINDNNKINYEMYFYSNKVLSNIDDLSFFNRLKLKKQAQRCQCDTIYLDLKRNFNPSLAGDTLEVNYINTDRSKAKITMMYEGMAFSSKLNKK